MTTTTKTDPKDETITEQPKPECCDGGKFDNEEYERWNQTILAKRKA
jgi:hypothetical protein